MKDTKRNLLLSSTTVLLLILLFEATIRFGITPTPNAYGRLGHIELPPFGLLPASTPPGKRDRSSWFEDLVVDGQKITVGDLWGFSRRDPALGYVTQENVISKNGWWQTNNIGARARNYTTKSTPEGKQRLLVFGESYAIGSRLRQEEMWSAVLDENHDSLEVVNLAVDGYGMAQSYLAYQRVKNKLDHDIVLLMFVPTADLWRDINVRRDLFGWEMYWILPRFVVAENGSPKLVESPFDSNTDTEDEEVTDSKLRKHLAAYDRFYFKHKYEEPWLIGKSILYKLWAKASYESQQRALIKGLLEPDSEALAVSKKIFAAMREEVLADGKKFVLVILPDHWDIEPLNENGRFATNWQLMVSSICISDSNCIDLSEELRQIPVDRLDRGYDGTHYGPKANRLMAGIIGRRLTEAGLLGE